MEKIYEFIDKSQMKNFNKKIYQEIDYKEDLKNYIKIKEINTESVTVDKDGITVEEGLQRRFRAMQFGRLLRKVDDVIIVPSLDIEGGRYRYPSELVGYGVEISPSKNSIGFRDPLARFIAWGYSIPVIHEDKIPTNFTFRESVRYA